MRAVVLMMLAACGTDDGPLPASEDPRTVPCDTFRKIGYNNLTPPAQCYFDIADIDHLESPFEPEPPATTSVNTIGAYCGPGCNGGSGATFVEGATWRTDAIRWTGATEPGVAVLVGDGSTYSCIWKRCERVE